VSLYSYAFMKCITETARQAGENAHYQNLYVHCVSKKFPPLNCL